MPMRTSLAKQEALRVDEAPATSAIWLSRDESKLTSGALVADISPSIGDLGSSQSLSRSSKKSHDAEILE